MCVKSFSMPNSCHNIYGDLKSPIVSVSHDSTFFNSLSFDSGTQDKVIGLYVDDQNKHTIWESLFR